MTTVITAPIGRDEFRQAVRRNIRSLLALTEAEQQDLAPRIGLSVSQLSDRLTGGAAWRDQELLNVAAAFETSYQAVVAMTADEFREAIHEAPPRMYGASSSVQMALFAVAA